MWDSGSQSLWEENTVTVTTLRSKPDLGSQMSCLWNDYLTGGHADSTRTVLLTALAKQSH
jgi:hypothetical protein